MAIAEKPTDRFLSLWENSDKFTRLESSGSSSTFQSTNVLNGSERTSPFTNLSSLSTSDRTILMTRLSANWPYSKERKALTWPIHAGLITNCVTSSIIATRINSDLFLFNPKAAFFESVRKCPKSPFVFGIYSSGVTYYMLYQMLITPKVFNEMSPCPSCVLINSIAIGLTTGIALPMLATPYLAHYVILNRESASSKYPMVKNMYEFLTLGFLGSKAARPVVPMLVAAQMIVSFGAIYALLWGRERMFNTLEYDSDLAKSAIASAQTATSLKQKILDFMKRVPLLSGMVPESPENERLVV